MNHRPLTPNSNISGATTNIDHRHAKVLFVLRKHRLRRSKLLKYNVSDRQPTTLRTLDDVLSAGDRTSNNVHLGLKTHSAHPQRLANTVLVINDELLRQDVYHLAIKRHSNSTRRVNYPLDIRLSNLTVFYRNNAITVETLDMTASNAGVNLRDLTTSHQLSILNGALDRLNRRLDVDDHPLA